MSMADVDDVFLHHDSLLARGIRRTPIGLAWGQAGCSNPRSLGPPVAAYWDP